MHAVRAYVEFIFCWPPASRITKLCCVQLSIFLNRGDLSVMLPPHVSSILLERQFYPLQSEVRNVSSIHWKPENFFQGRVFFDCFEYMPLVSAVSDELKFYEITSLIRPWKWVRLLWGFHLPSCFLLSALQICSLTDDSAHFFRLYYIPLNPRLEKIRWILERRILQCVAHLQVLVYFLLWHQHLLSGNYAQNVICPFGFP